MNNIEESVFAVSTDEFWKLIPYKEKGLIKGNSEVLKSIVQNGLFLKRSEAEEDPSFKHTIYSKEHRGREKKGSTINSLWEQEVI
jgi:predicted NUDIX family phosphoesterase